MAIAGSLQQILEFSPNPSAEAAVASGHYASASETQLYSIRMPTLNFITSIWNTAVEIEGKNCLTGIFKNKSLRWIYISKMLWSQESEGAEDATGNFHAQITVR